MKQIEKTPSIVARLRKSLGDATADVSGYRVYEAIALNTRPLRKLHPLYNGSRAERSLLLEMAAALETESRPVQIMHDQDVLPIGRVFHGEVLDKGTESELRVLFFLDASAEEETRKVDAGTVDQVSVSVLPKHIYCSASGFDFLSDEATFEQRYTGQDKDGNVLGKNGVYGRLVGLDKWFELSLVGTGGAQNARIVSRAQSHFGESYQRLAAHGFDPNVLVLEASAGSETMDLTQLIDQLTTAKADLSTSTAQLTTLQATNVQQAARIVELEAQLGAAENSQVVAQKDAEIAALAPALDALKGVATKVLTAAGKPGETVPDTVPELEALINETTVNLAAALAAGGRGQEAASDAERNAPISLTGFRIRR